jgi:hypothetical protein
VREILADLMSVTGNALDAARSTGEAWVVGALADYMDAVDGGRTSRVVAEAYLGNGLRGAAERYAQVCLSSAAQANPISTGHPLLRDAGTVLGASALALGGLVDGFATARSGRPRNLFQPVAVSLAGPLASGGVWMWDPNAVVWNTLGAQWVSPV